MAKSQTKASNKYNAKAYDRLAVQVYKGSREIIRAAADKAGESTNAYVIGAIDQRMKSEGLAGLPTKPEAPEPLPAPQSSEPLEADELTEEKAAELIEVLNLSVRTYNIARRAGCTTIGELAAYIKTDSCVIAPEGNTYKEITQAIADYKRQ